MVSDETMSVPELLRQKADDIVATALHHRISFRRGIISTEAASREAAAICRAAADLVEGLRDEDICSQCGFGATSGHHETCTVGRFERRVREVL